LSAEPFERGSHAARIARIVWRCAKILLMAFAAIGPAAPPPPLPRREVAELREEKGEERREP
jgi:hypothetical protein